MDYTNYKAMYSNPESSLRFDLYQNYSHEATVQSGSVKSSYKVKEGGTALYDSKRSGYTVTVNRLLWLDGWESSTGEGEAMIHGAEMTLVVLKIVLASNDPNRKVAYMSASLALEDSEGQTSGWKNEPLVEAWAPFGAVKRSNATTAQHTKSIKTEASVQLGYSSINASIGSSSEAEISWEQTSFDEERAHGITNSKSGKQNGVMWILEQNQLQNAGVAPELCVAVLFSRSSQKPYLVRFGIDARVGTLDDFKNKTRQFFGLPSDRTQPFLVTPFMNEVCSSEGKEMKKCIDVNNLGKLRGQDQALNLKWGPSCQIELNPPAPASSNKYDSNSDHAQDESARGQDRERRPDPVIAPTPLPSNQLSLPLPPLVVSWGVPISAANAGYMNFDSSRLTVLEGRVAQLEARLASQDSLILQLQHSLLAQQSSK
ncbi:hypothetical protein J3F84DRAFT_368678 [Trichoderma pleuroticola]